MRRAWEWLRWKRLLASCRYDPHDDRSVEEASDRDFVIAGCPRSGTSLLAAQLFRPPEIVTVMEPWDGLRMPLAQLMEDLRSEVLSGTLARGRLDVDAHQRGGEVRWVRDRGSPVDVDVADNFHLGVKWPTFWQYVPLLRTTRFLICVRHPAEVVASFAQVGGRLAKGLDYAVAFNQRMNAYLRAETSDALVRGALMWEYINSNMLAHLQRSNTKVVRYERWFDDPDSVLTEVGEFLGVEVTGSTVTIRPPETQPTSRVRQIVADHCPSASALGYEV